jgi:hypothetical protein
MVSVDTHLTRQSPHDVTSTARGLLDEQLVAFLHSGLSFAVGTRDGDLAPEGIRAWALNVAPDRNHVDVFVLAEAATRTLTNLERHPHMAVVCDSPPDLRACQLKGYLTGWRDARDDERPEVERQLSELCKTLELIGIPEALYARIAHYWPALVLRMRVTDVYAQNPGPGAGAPLLPGESLRPARCEDGPPSAVTAR